MSKWPRSLFYLCLAAAIALDQAGKAWASTSLQPLRSVEIVPGLFNLTYVQNRGIAFGMFAGQGLVIGLIVIALGLFALYQSRGLDWRGVEPNLVGGALVGGAIGNIIDRLRQGYVVDFFDVHWHGHYWPVFNVADSLICISVAWIALRQFVGTAPAKKVEA
jgi:signal peptidase II